MKTKSKFLNRVLVMHRWTAALPVGLLILAATTAGAAETKTGIGLKQIADGFVSPTTLLPLDDGSGRLLVADQVGVVYVLDKAGKRLEKPFLDARSRLTKLNEGLFDERGLLGLALHPRFKRNGKLYVVYSAPLRDKSLKEWDHTMNLSEFKVMEKDRAQVDPASERIILQVDKPYFNHNGGCPVFGPDGYLYLSVGDGGNSNDTGRGHSEKGNGQDLTTFLAKILRIDVNKGDPYAIPRDNPFVGVSARPEVFAYGVRNSWRMSFDRGGKHELFAADVGQTMFEEVNLIVKGGNYGWNVREGTHCFDPKNPNKPPENCPKVGLDGKPFIDPIVEYKNINGFRKDPEALGVSVTGGYVYRGKALPRLNGRYVFADWSRNFVMPDGVVYVATRPGASRSKQWTVEPLDLRTHPKGQLKAFVVALGQDLDGELYLLTNNSNSLVGKTGKVYKLVKQE